MELFEFSLKVTCIKHRKHTKIPCLKKTCVGDGGELELALDDLFAVRSCSEK